MGMVRACAMKLFLGAAVNYVLSLTNLEPTVLKVGDNCVW